MRWPWQHKRGHEVEEDPCLARAEDHLEELKQRADRVAISLMARDRRNHWGETIAAIARRERENGV